MVFVRLNVEEVHATDLVNGHRVRLRYRCLLRIRFKNFNLIPFHATEVLTPPFIPVKDAFRTDSLLLYRTSQETIARFVQQGFHLFHCYCHQDLH
jgi:hypothetical protein